MAESAKFRSEDQPTEAGFALHTLTKDGSSSSNIPSSSDTPTLLSPVPSISNSNASSSSPTSFGGASSDSPASLRPGMVLGARYAILEVIGQGGMGAVYKAEDRELNRFVALKVIRPELASDPSMLQRFKQEILLASKISNRNVIRIYDLGEAEGIKFITMEFIEGKDLRALIREKKKFTPEEAVDVVQQMCLALDATHSIGVIHRDLKPQNVMQDASGRILVMDFGLARTLQLGGLTQTGALVGTMEYMSPEQALGKDLDQRSDIFAIGLIFYELLTGKTPFGAESAIASLIKRTQERAIPVSDVDGQIPGALSGIVSKCLERDLTQRYQDVSSILADLDTWKDKRAAGTINFDANVKPWGRTLPWPIIAGIMTVVVLAAMAFMLRDRLFKPSSTAEIVAPAPALSLAILPFRNASGDQALDWLGPSVSDMLSTDVGQSAKLRTVSPDRLHQVLTDLQITPNIAIDPTMLRRIAEFTGADTVVWGQYARFGGEIRIDATLQDLKHDRRVPLKIEIPSEKDVPAGIGQLADSIRHNLGMSNDVEKELRATSFQPTSKSMTALREYNEGTRLLRNGKSGEAQKQFEAATKEDPAFGLAYSRLAQTYASLGYDSDAERSAQKAVELSDALPQPEKYLIAAIQAQIANNYPEAIKSYQSLAKAWPANADVQSALARLYEDTGDFVKASQNYQNLLQANPKDILAIVSTGRIAIKRGNPQDSLDPLNRALSLSIQLDNREEQSASLHLMGVAYRMLNKPEDALRNFQQALAIRRATNEKRGIAFSLNEMAVVESTLGKPKDALAHYQEALQVRREIGDKRGLGDTLLDLGNFYDDSGDHDRALKMYKEALQLERDIGNQGLQAICLNNIGAVYFEKSEYADARTYYEQALQLREKSKAAEGIVESVHNLAETLARMGQYDQAITQYMRALELHRTMDDTRGAAVESYSMGTLFDYQGRFGAAINSKQEALNTFRNLKDRTFWMAELLGGYAEALTLAGRGAESQPYLDEALSLSRELKNDGMVAQTLDFEGDLAYYSGNVKSARSYYQSALQAASHTKEPDKTLIAKADLARIDIEEGRAAAATGNLRSVAQQAEEQGFAYMGVECSIAMAKALLRIRDYPRARTELEHALQQADKLGLKPLSAIAHYELAIVLQQSGNSTDAPEHFKAAIQLIDNMRKEPGAEKILQRSDLKAIYDDASQALNSAKN
jgi:eukaryotic-like serine/threonine-protein kinase